MPLLLPACLPIPDPAQGAPIGTTVAAESRLPGSGQSDKGQNGQNDHNKPDNVDDVIHG
jgi:hypothetical protein